jgi:predicted MFS family arabinose efflux permease
VLRERLAEGAVALREREFRLLFGATLTTSLGDAVATIALAFAVLAVAGPTSLGLVLAARQGASAAVLLFGGVLSDRVRRNLVLVGASLVQGAAQAAIAVAVLTGSATVAMFVVCGLLWGLGDGLVVPAEVGLVPQTVAPEHLQQANALQGLSRSAVRVVGPALGGVLVVALDSGWALAIDSASFFACAALLARMTVAPRPDVVREPFFAELKAGWREFTSRTWLWTTVVIFGLGNVFFMFLQVLGPTVAVQRLGGAGAWAAIVTSGGVGALAGGLTALRHRPSKPLVACILWPLTTLLEFAALASGAPTWLIAIGAFAGGFGIANHVALWFTIFQREIPEHAQSRVSSYDAFGSFVLNPLGAAIAGPLAVALGTSEALWLAAAAILISNVAMLLIPAVWRIRAYGEGGIRTLGRG